MKNNLLRLLAVALLLLCLGATANIMAQNTGNDLASVEPITDPHDLNFGEPVLSTETSEPPAATFYAVVERMKVLPGMWDKYLEAEKVWKKIHQQSKAKGEIMDWFLFQCLYPGGTDAPYEFITVTYYKSGKELGAPFVWAEKTKGLTPAEVEIADGAEKTRNLIDRHLYSFFNGCDQATCKPGKYLQLFANKAKPGKTSGYEKFLEDGTAMRLEAIKSGKIQGWSIWKRVYPGSPDLETHTAVYAYESLDALLKNSAPVDFSAEMKKVKPGQTWEDFMKQMNELRDFAGSEMWEQVDSTQ